MAADGTVVLALTSGLVVLLGTVSDLPAKYEDVAAIIANAPLRGAHTIDVTVPQSPTVGPVTRSRPAWPRLPQVTDGCPDRASAVLDPGRCEPYR